jgi:hypothetical protein
MAMLGRVKLRDICPGHPFSGVAICFGSLAPHTTDPDAPQPQPPMSEEEAKAFAAKARALAAKVKASLEQAITEEEAALRDAPDGTEPQVE